MSDGERGGVEATAREIVKRVFNARGDGKVHSGPISLAALVQEIAAALRAAPPSQESIEDVRRAAPVAGATACSLCALGHAPVAGFHDDKGMHWPCGAGAPEGGLTPDVERDAATAAAAFYGTDQYALLTEAGKENWRDVAKALRSAPSNVGHDGLTANARDPQGAAGPQSSKVCNLGDHEACHWSLCACACHCAAPPSGLTPPSAAATAEYSAEAISRLASIRERLAKATPGPWAWGRLISDQAGDYVVWRHRGEQETTEHAAIGNDGEGPQREYVGNVGGVFEPVIEATADDVTANQIFEGAAADAALVAHAPDDLAWLLARLDAHRESTARAAPDGDVERVVRALRKSARAYHHEMHRLSDPANADFESCSSPVCRDALAALRVAPAASPVAWQEALFTYRARVYQYAPLEAAAELDAKYEAVLDAALATGPATPPAAPGPGR